jgi:hypothetical protein
MYECMIVYGEYTTVYSTVPMAVPVAVNTVQYSVQ